MRSPQALKRDERGHFGRCLGWLAAGTACRGCIRIGRGDRPPPAVRAASRPACSRRGRGNRLRRRLCQPAATLQDVFRFGLLLVQEADLFLPDGVRAAPPFDAVIALALEHRQRLPARFFLLLLGPARVFLQFSSFCFLVCSYSDLVALVSRWNVCTTWSRALE